MYDRLRASQALIETVADEAQDRLSVSLIAYGPHSFDTAIPDTEPLVLTWAGTSDQALMQLGRLRAQGPANIGYPAAAQLECVLTLVAQRLDDQEGRPVLVAAGSRPSFPPRQDPVTGILPCPHRHDWQRAIARLVQQFKGISFGAIHDRETLEGIWTHLGSRAVMRPDTLNIRDFAPLLGLLSPKTQYVPLPLVDK